jgi:hypothetical protein
MLPSPVVGECTLTPVQLWASPALGCSGLVVLVVVDDRGEQPGWAPAGMPRSVRIIDRATAHLAAEMLHDAVEVSARPGSAEDVDIDAIIDRAVRATSP